MIHEVYHLDYSKRAQGSVLEVKQSQFELAIHQDDEFSKLSGATKLRQLYNDKRVDKLFNDLSGIANRTTEQQKMYSVVKSILEFRVVHDLVAAHLEEGDLILFAVAGKPIVFTHEGGRETYSAETMMFSPAD